MAPSGVRAVDWSAEYERLAPRLARYAYRLVGDADVAADLVQDSFVSAMRAHASLHEPGTLIPWLFRIVSNKAMSHLRRRRVLRAIGLGGNAEDAVLATETKVLVRAALAQIPAAQATALVLAYHEGFDRVEIAEITGTSPETVKTRLARGRKNFIAAFRNLEGTET